jgi:hypothetical protein
MRVNHRGADIAVAEVPEPFGCHNRLQANGLQKNGEMCEQTASKELGTSVPLFKTTAALTPL